MSAWFEQFVRMFASETGNLTYHLVLSFSIALALSLMINMDAPHAGARRRRTLLGLALLLLLQFGLFAVSGLTWQAMLNGQVLLPPLDRAATLLGLVVIVWLWCFPDPSPAGDVGSALLALLVIAGTVMSTLMWSRNPESLTFNGTMPDLEAAIFGVSAAVLGILVLLASRPDGYWFGIGMLASMAAGFGLHLALPPYGGDYPAVIRVAQMIAFPFLALLTQRFPAPAPSAPPNEAAALPAPAAARVYDDPIFWQDLGRLAAETDNTRLGREAAAFLAQAVQADACAILYAPGPSGEFPIVGAYDRAHKRTLEVKTLATQSVPVIAAAWRNARSRRIAAGSAAPDLGFLAEAFGLERIGALLFHPLLSADGKPRAGVLLLAAQPGQDWDDAAQELLARLAKLMVHFLQRNREMAASREEITQARQTARLAQDSAQQALDEKQKLQSRIIVLNENAERDRAQIDHLSAIAAAHEIALQTIAQVQAENARIKDAARQAEKHSQERDAAREGEMRLTLQEIAMMQQALFEADAKITALKMGRVDGAPSMRQFETIAAVARELRQQLASIRSNAARLQSEAGGAADERLRKLSGRITSSTERMEGLLVELAKAVAPESNAARLEFEEVNVRDLIQQAVVDCEARLRLRRISVKFDLPQNTLKVISDRHALRSVLNNLLENAGTASPEGGQVVLRARPETRENEEEYVLIQVTDSGAGIPAGDFVRVFAPQSVGQDERPVPGLGKSAADLPHIKSLVEAMGGLTWVDSVLGRGATFSVMLPVAPQGRKNGKQAAQ